MIEIGLRNRIQNKMSVVAKRTSTDMNPLITELVACAKKVKTHSKFGAEMDMDYVDALLTRICNIVETGADIGMTTRDEPIDVTAEIDLKIYKDELQKQASHIREQQAKSMEYKETIELHETAINAVMDENRDALKERDARIAEVEAKAESRRCDYNELVKKYNDKFAEWKTYADKITSQFEEREKTYVEMCAEYKKRITKLETTDREHEMSDGTKMTFDDAIEERNRYSNNYDELLRICNEGGRVSVTNGVETTTYNILMAERNKIVRDYNELTKKWDKLVTDYNDLSKRHTTQTGELDVMRIDMACLSKGDGKKHTEDMKRLTERNQRICDGKDRIIENYKRQVEALDNELRKKGAPITFGGGGDSDALKRTIQTMTRDHATKIEELKAEIRKLKRPVSSTQHLPSVKYDKLLDEHKELNKKYDALKSRCGDAKADITAMRQIEHLRNELKQRDERIKELRTACILGQDC